MAEPQHYQDKLCQCQVGGPSKPFIDHNLQLHLPNWKLFTK